MMQANDDWRNDDRRREEWRAELERRAAIYDAAYDHVVKALQIFQNGGYISDNTSASTIYNRGRSAVEQAFSRMNLDRSFIVNEPNEVYLGNLAAFGRPHDNV